MTLKSIEEQIGAIRKATATALTSPEAALDFLQRAGIVSTDKKIAGKKQGISGGALTKTK